jgi:type I restriction enzyme, S subunit
MRSSYKRIGDYVQQVNVRNSGLSVTNLEGVSINKYFMPSVANINGTDLTTYKVVAKEQFAFNPMHVGRDEVLPIAMLETDDSVIVSPAYVVFAIIDKQTLLPEYLMMWCRRPEFDRNAWFTTDSSVRGGFSWNDFSEMELPVPSPEKQREIVREYHTIVDRIKLNERLNRKLEETAQAIYKRWFVDFEFPISAEYAAAIGKPELEGQPYKSSGGEMVFNEVLKQEIPKKWKDCLLSDFGTIITGKTPSSADPHHFGTEVPFITPTDYPSYFIHMNGSARALSKAGANKLKNKILPEGSILVTCIGSDMGKTVIARSECITNQQLNSIMPDAKEFTCYLFYHLKNKYEELRNLAIGSSTMLMINKSDFGRVQAIKPCGDCLNSFSKTINRLHDYVWVKERELRNLFKFQSIILSGLATK